MSVVLFLKSWSVDDVNRWIVGTEVSANEAICLCLCRERRKHLRSVAESRGSEDE